jgi:hypothetical protein
VKYKEEEEQQQQQEQEQQGSVANTAEEGLRAQEVRALQKKKEKSESTVRKK